MVDEYDNLRTDVDAVGDPGAGDHGGDPRLANGTEIEGYVVDGVVGRGGMGVVYSATHRVIGKRAAVKVLRAEVSQNPVAVERFIQEARAVNAIGHPNIIDIFDFGTLPDGRAFHLMDLMIGESLRKRLRSGALHPSEAASVIEEVTSALMAAHDKGFVHRDLKPDNIFLIAQEGAWPEVKLLDFGLAKLMPESGTTAAFITKTGVMLGTPEYMSPEQARGQPVDYRTDVYALGICMFEILAGERPFPATGDAFSTLQYHAEEPPPSIGSVVPQLPPEMVQLVDAMLAKEPAARPSLAAVRTVIKRLRTTQLPTRSVAGAEIASFSNPGMSAQLGVSASRLGAEPMGLTKQHEVPSVGSAPYSQYSAHQQSVASAAPLPHPPATGSQPPEERFAPDDIMVTTPRARAPVTGQNQAAGLAASQKSPAYASTRLGVAPAPRPVKPSQQLATQQPRSTVSSRVWLIAGALLAIAAGIGLALVLVGR